MSIPRQYAADTPLWYDRRLPTLEDFDGDQTAFDQAMADYVTGINGPLLSETPNFGIPEQQVFNHQTGQYEMRGGMPDRFEGMSQGEFAANQLNSRFSNIQKKQQAGMYSPEQRKMDLLALQSRAQVRPDEMQSAYGAMRADGTPVLADPVLAWMEDILGFSPGENANFTPPVQEVEAPASPSPFGPEDTWTVQPDGSLVNQNGDVWIPGGGSLLPNSAVPADDAFVNSVLGGASGLDEMQMRRLEATARRGQMTPQEWQEAMLAYNEAVANGIDPNIALTAILFGGY